MLYLVSFSHVLYKNMHPFYQNLFLSNEHVMLMPKPQNHELYVN